MSSSKQQNNSLWGTAINLVLVGGVAATFAGACVSSSSGGGSGGAAGSTTPVGAGGGVSAGGATGSGGAGPALPECTTDAGVAVAVSGNACAPNPALLTIKDNTPGTSAMATATSCPIGLWANDGTSAGYFYLPWCNTPGTPSDCTLSMECLNGAIHITGSYNGGGDGMGGFGLNLQTTFPDAGPGCQMIKGDGFTGITVDVTNTKSPNNHLYVGLGLANGNQGEYTATLASGVQTIKLPWSLFKNKGNCGGVPGPGIQNLNFGFDWFNDGADHPVDVILSNIGFY